jgi:hypothetical protein
MGIEDGRHIDQQPEVQLELEHGKGNRRGTNFRPRVTRIRRGIAR